MHARSAAVAALVLVLATSPLGRADLPCVMEDLPCPFHVEGGEVGPGETRTVTGPARLDEPIEVRGTLVLQGAQLFVDPALPSLVVHDGGTLRIVGSVIDTQDGEPGAYVVHVLPGGSLEVVGSVLRNGHGILVESDDVTLTDSAILGGGPRGVEFAGVPGRLTRMQVDALVGVDARDGTVVVEQSRFTNASVAMRFVNATATVVGNVVAASSNGIFADRTTLAVQSNQLDDRADPAGRALSMTGSEGLIEDNVFSKWGTGLYAEDSLVSVSGNAFLANVQYGILASNVSATIVDNSLHANALAGMLIDTAPNLTLDRNVVKDSALWQVIVVNAPDASVRNNTFAGGVYYGFAGSVVPRIRLEDNLAGGTVGFPLYVELSEDAVVRRNTVTGGGTGITVWGPSGTLEDNLVTGTLVRGFDVQATDPAGGITLHRDRASTGTGTGFRLGGAALSAEDLHASGYDVGFALDAAGAPMRLDRANASGNGVGVVVKQAGAYTLADLRAYDNEKDAVRVLSDAVVWMQGAAMGGHEEGFGVNATLDLTTPVDARHSWWGDPSGPSGAGPGAGDAVTPGVEHAPWLTSRPA